MKKSLITIVLLSFVALFSTTTKAQSVLTADGPGNTYELINSILAPTGGDVVEVPECVHPEFGRHIAEVWDTDLNKYVFEFYIHRDIDNDRCINFDRQRVEIKTYDASPANLKGEYGETVVYKWQFKVPSGFQPSPNFTHIHQIKAVGGSDDDPIFTLTPRYKSSGNQMELIHDNTTKVASLSLSLFEGNWVEATETIKIDSLHGTYAMSIKNVITGAVILNYTNNDLKTIRSNNTFIRPKWGIYRSILSPEYLRDETLRFNNFSIFEYQKQTITFDPLPFKKISDPDFSPGATASSGLAVSYTSSNPNVATIVDNKIHMVSLGTTVITATQAGNDVYSAASPVQQTLVVSNLNYTLNCTEDAYTYGSTLTTNYGTATSIQVKENGNVSFARKGYVKFDLSGLSLSGLGIAQLRLYANSVSASTLITVASCNDSWTETGINYNNAPAVLANLSSATVSSINTYYAFDVTKYIESRLSGGLTTASFVVYDNNSANTLVRFNSREASSFIPELVLSGLSTKTSETDARSKNFSYSFNNTTGILNYVSGSEINTGLTLLIFNIQVQQLTAIQSTTNENRTSYFDLNNLPAGIYICRISSNSQSSIFKISIN